MICGGHSRSITTILSMRLGLRALIVLAQRGRGGSAGARQGSAVPKQVVMSPQTPVPGAAGRCDRPQQPGAQPAFPIHRPVPPGSACAVSIRTEPGGIQHLARRRLRILRRAMRLKLPRRGSTMFRSLHIFASMIQLPLIAGAALTLTALGFAAAQ
jgi:hypothetical protein